MDRNDLEAINFDHHASDTTLRPPNNSPACDDSRKVIIGVLRHLIQNYTQSLQFFKNIMSVQEHSAIQILPPNKSKTF